jgi:hypothetical protein
MFVEVREDIEVRENVKIRKIVEVRETDCAAKGTRFGLTPRSISTISPCRSI